MPNDVTRRAFLRLAGLGSVALALSACQAAAPSVSPTSAPASAGAPAAGAATAPEPFTLPIVSQPLTLSYWAPMSTNVKGSSSSAPDSPAPWCHRRWGLTGITVPFALRCSAAH